MITVSHVTKAFDGFRALNNVSLEVGKGEFIALLGPSGSGKTSLLRIIAGLEFQDEGQVLIDDQDMTGRPIAERGVGFVFQHYALFRHMSVARNVAFGLSVRKRANRPSRAAIRARAEELLRLVQLEGLGGRLPAQLSGGQRQRVALARALAVEPRLLLLDEPFGALDAKVRKDLRRWLRALHDQMGLTSIFVTHDQEEALELADRIVVMNHGVIEQIGTPEEVYTNPASAFVADFVGETNRVAVRVSGGQVQLGNRAVGVDAEGLADGPAQLLFRPHDIVTVNEGEPGIAITVANHFRKGGKWRIEGHPVDPVHQGESIVEIDIDAHQAPPVHGTRLHFRAERHRLFPGDGSQSNGG